MSFLTTFAHGHGINATELRQTSGQRIEISTACGIDRAKDGVELGSGKTTGDVKSSHDTIFSIANIESSIAHHYYKVRL